MNALCLSHRRNRLGGLILAACLGMFVPPTQAQIQTQVRLLTHNVFGTNEQYCEQRARGFGHIIANENPAYDILAVTEYYDNLLANCDSGPLLEAITCTGRYLNSNNTELFYPHDTTFQGGMGLFTLWSICDVEAHSWNYQPIIPSPQGVFLARIKLPNTTVTVDVYVVHIHSSGADGCDYECRQEQLGELRDFIRLHSVRSGNPVIVMGDFNFGGPPTCLGPEGYNQILISLGSPRDFWFEAHPCGQQLRGNPFNPCDFPAPCTGTPSPKVHTCLSDAGNCAAGTLCANVNPIAPECNPGSASWCPWAGYTWDTCLNTVTPNNGLERIDYIFLITDPALTSNAWDVELVDALVTNFTAIIDLVVACDGPCEWPHCESWCPPYDPPPFVGNVSDHLGVEATIRIYGKPAVWVDNLYSGAESGTSCNPYNTLGEGVAGAPSGYRVLVRSGSYPVNPIINRNVTLQAIGGLVRIGQ